VIAGPPAVIFAFVMGLYAYMTASITPLHPDPKGVSSAAAWAPSPSWTGAVGRSRQLVRASVVEQNLPGLSIAVGADGEIVWAEGFGWADLEKRPPVTPRTLFRTGGASIALTSAGVNVISEPA